MKLVYFSRYPPAHCGVGEYTRMLVQAISSFSKHTKPLVVATTLSGNEPYVEAKSRVQVYPVVNEDQHDYEKFLDVLTEVDGADIVHVEHEYGIFRNGEELLKTLEEARYEKLAKRVFITLHTVYHPASMRHDALYFQQALGEVVDYIVVHSRLQEFELEAQGVNIESIVRIPHGTLINPYTSVPRDVLIEELGIDKDALQGLILVTPGFIRRDKGFDVIAEALSRVDFEYTFIAAGELKNSYVEDIIRSKTKSVILERYLSHDEILKLIALSDVIMLPYKDKPGTYSVSGILHLSMGSLRPIIGSRVPRLVELYMRAPRLCVPPNNVEELAAKLKWIYNNYDLAVAYMSEVYAYAARTQWPRMAQRHLRLYREALEKEVRVKVGAV